MTHVALLRAVNLAGKNKVGMADLRALLGGLGLQDVRTLLQSGNAAFSGGKGGGAQLEKALEGEVAKRFGLATDVFVRSAREWEAVIAANPFPREAAVDPGHLLVLFLKAAPPEAAVEDLRAAIKGREIVKARGRELYVVYPDGIGRSRLTVALIEKKLDTRGTGRNWNTVLRLGALASRG